MRRNAKPVKLRRVFGVIGEALTESGAQLMISNSDVALQPLLSAIEDGLSDEEIGRLYRVGSNISATARAWHARFGADAERPATLPPGPKGLLLDENIPQGLLPFATKAFGFSSHVEAEGLSRITPGARLASVPRKMIDSEIAAFALREQFQAIVTRDTDFKALAQKPDHPAGKIHIILFGGQAHCVASMQQALTAHRSVLQAALAAPPRLQVLG